VVGQQAAREQPRGLGALAHGTQQQHDLLRAIAQPPPQWGGQTGFTEAPALSSVMTYPSTNLGI
jgi:hypothetical protein